jgi:hypothetical protein
MIKNIFNPSTFLMEEHFAISKIHNHQTLSQHNVIMNKNLIHMIDLHDFEKFGKL